ncbi:MAG: hypothetical protein D6746_09880, partial [Bacteroidetes bacterium]
MEENTQESATAPTNPDEIPVDLDALVAKLTTEPEKESESATEATPEGESSKADGPDDNPEAEAEDKAKAEEKQAEDDSDERAKRLAFLAQREQELRAKERELAEKSEKTPKPETLAQEFLADPVAFLDKYAKGLDYTGLATQLLAKELGEDTLPDELKEDLSRASLERRLAELERAQKEAIEAAKRAKEEALREVRVDMLDQQLAKMASSVSAETYPHLATFAKDNPEDVYRALATVAARRIEAGEWPEASEVADALERALAEEVGRFKPLFSSQPTDKKEPDPEPEERSLSSGDIREQPTKAPKKRIEEYT